MSCEKSIRRIIEDTGLSRSEMQEMIREIVESRNGITSEEQAIKVIIKDLCIKL